MRKLTSILILAIALVGSVSAQSLDGLRKKAYDLAFEVVNTAYEEYLENQELEAAKKAEEEALEAGVDKEMYIIELESKVMQLEAEVRLLEKENNRLKELLRTNELKEGNENESYFFRY